MDTLGNKQNGSLNFEKIIIDFVNSANGLTVVDDKKGELTLRQSIDSKHLKLNLTHIEDVFTRLDSDGSPFLQVNFINGKKILLTQKLIGFKPLFGHDLNPEKLPRVVTTPDLVSVVEAIEETANGSTEAVEEVTLLKRVFEAVVSGGEDVGFDLTQERAWLKRIMHIKSRPSA